MTDRRSGCGRSKGREGGRKGTTKVQRFNLGFIEGGSNANFWSRFGKTVENAKFQVAGEAKEWRRRPSRHDELTQFDERGLVKLPLGRFGSTLRWGSVSQSRMTS